MKTLGEADRQPRTEVNSAATRPLTETS